jgi:hypothetical protein
MRLRGVRRWRPLALLLLVLAARPPAPASAQAAVDSATAAAYDAFHGLTVKQIEIFLRTARIVDVNPIGVGVTKPLRATLDDGRIRHGAAIQAIDACEVTAGESGKPAGTVCDSYRYNIAAYRIGKLLGLTSIPPAVERTFDRRPAAFTWWIDDAHTLSDLEVRGEWRPDMDDWQRQAGAITVFDELIFNSDRHQANLIMDPRRQVWMIDHTRAFRADAQLKSAYRLEDLAVDPVLLARLRDLTEAALDHCCATYLKPEERTAVMARRDSILAYLREAAEPAPAAR